MKNRLHFAWILTLSLFASTSLRAWNKPGHMLTAAIAYDELTVVDSVARDKVIAILREHPQYDSFWKPKLAGVGWGQKNRTLFMLAARWPDDIRSDEDYHHGKWHYINYTYAPPATAPGAILDEDEHILIALENNMTILQSNASRETKAVALCWIFHLIGDLHQPLHTTALVNNIWTDGDSGGTEFFVRRDDDNKSPMGLHGYWDGLVINSEQFTTVRNRAVLLRQKPEYARLQLPELNRAATDFEGIAKTESFTIAVQSAYRNGALQGSKKKNKNAPVLPADYEDTVKPIAERRAVLAGYRLCDVLKALY